ARGAPAGPDPDLRKGGAGRLGADLRYVARRVRAVGQQHPEAVLVEDRHLELHGLVVLRPGRVADDDEVGLLRDGGGGLPAAREDRLLGLVAAEGVERAGDDDAYP